MRFLTVTTVVGRLDVQTDVAPGIEVVRDRIGPQRAFRDVVDPSRPVTAHEQQVAEENSIPLGRRDHASLVSVQNISVFRPERGRIVQRTERVDVVMRGALPRGNNGVLVGCERHSFDRRVLVMWQLLSRQKGSTSFFPPKNVTHKLWAADSDVKSDTGVRAFMQVLADLSSGDSADIHAVIGGSQTKITIRLRDSGDIQVVRD